MPLVQLITLPLLGALLGALPLGARVRDALTVGITAALLAFATGLALEVGATGRVDGPSGLLAGEGLGALLALLIAFVALSAALFAGGYLRAGRAAPAARRAFHPLFHLFVASMLLVVLAEQLALAWVGLALTTLFSAFLVAHEDTPEALEAAWKYVVLTTIGAVVALLGLLILYWGLSATGGRAFTWSALALAAPAMPRPLLWTGFLLVVAGAGTKAGLAPMHTWLPDAHSQAPAPICALLSGVETSTALYLLLRLRPLLAAAGIEAAGTVMIGFGLGSLAVAALLLVHVRDLKRLLAYSTVEHMGIVLVAAGIGGAASFGAVFQILAHSLAKSYGFLTAGAVARACASHRIADLRGLMSRSPLLGAALLAAALGVAGAPPSAVFLSELAIIGGGLGEGAYLAVAALVVLVVVAFCAVLRHAHAMVLTGEGGGLARPSAGMLAALALALAPLLLFGLYLPAPLRELLGAAAASLGSGP